MHSGTILPANLFLAWVQAWWAKNDFAGTPAYAYIAYKTLNNKDTSCPPPLAVVHVTLSRGAPILKMEKKDYQRVQHC